MKNLNITERQSDSITILDLDGKIIFGEESAQLHKILRLLVERGEKKVLLNFKGVYCIDSSGLGELVGGYVAFKRQEGEIRLFNLSQNVHQIIELTKLSTVFEIYDSESEAIESFKNQSSKSVRAIRAV